MTKRTDVELTRRTLMTALGAAGAAIGIDFQASAAETAKPPTYDPRGYDGILRRLPTLQLEGLHDFLKGYKVWSLYDLTKKADKRATEIFQANGLAKDAPVPMEKLVELLEADPTLAMTGMAFMDIQKLKIRTLMDTFNADADRYLAELETFDKAGPGKLELNPTMHIDAYLRHEIHTMPGGYCGNPFGGYLYHYGTLVMTNGRDAQDLQYDGYASAMPIPKDGKVKRILDLGTGIGQMATSLKKKYPDAEVWGIDPGAPMLRYAHMRAIDIGLDVNFAQRVAEDTKFPDNYFDLVTSRIMLHEVTADASRAIVKETQRILRPGGVFYPMDVYTSNKVPTEAFERYRDWWIYRWNNEVWWLDYATLDFNGAMRKAGLQVIEDGPASGWRDVMRQDMGKTVPNVMAIKT